MALPTSPVVEELLSARDWLTRLALQLTRDPATADDLLQDTWVTALRARPDDRGSLRAWLGSVLRNHWRMRQRGESRRRARERAAADPESAPSPRELLERAQMQRTVVDAVLELDEIYRSVVLARYFADLPPRRIAAELGIPVSTVKTRLDRAHRKLRTEIERRSGGDRPALAGLLLLAGGMRKGPVVGALLMNSKQLVLGAAAVALTAAGIVIASRTGPPPANPSTPSDTGSTAPLSAGLDQAAQRTSGTVREAVVSASTHPSPDPVAADLVTFTGRALLVDATPAAGVRIGLERGATTDEATTAITDAAGRFRLPVPASTTTVRVAEPDRITVLEGRVEPSSAATGVEPVVIVAPRRVVRATVVDAVDGAALSGADVALRLPPGFRSRFAHIMDYSQTPRWSTRSTASSEPVTLEVPYVAGAELVAELSGYLSARVPLPETATDRPLRLALERPEPVLGSIGGRVTDLGGHPVADALVSMGWTATSTDERGHFVLSLEDAREGSRTIVAMARGSQPARHELDEHELSAARGENSASAPFVHLRLGPDPWTLEGRVVDDRGEPVGGIRVWPTKPQVAGLTSVEGWLAESDSPRWPFVVSDEDGRFALRGLLDRERGYDVSAMAPDSLARVDSGPFVRGSFATVHLPTGAVLDRVSGVVVDGTNRPVEGAAVAAYCDAIRLPIETGGFATSHGRGPQTTTDAEGQFVLEGVGRSRTYLQVSGERIVEKSFGRDDAGGLFASSPPHGLRLVVSLRIHVRVEIADPGLGDEFGVLDATGDPLVIHRISGSSTRSLERFGFTDGRSDVLTVDERARTIVLYRNGVEVRRQPVTLRPGDVNRISF